MSTRIDPEYKEWLKGLKEGDVVAVDNAHGNREVRRIVRALKTVVYTYFDASRRRATAFHRSGWEQNGYGRLARPTEVEVSKYERDSLAARIADHVIYRGTPLARLKHVWALLNDVGEK